MIDGGLRPLFRVRVIAHWQSVETGGTGLGVPDSNYCMEGVEGWVEFKHTTGWTCTLRPEQVAWHARRARAGGRTYVAVRRRTKAGPRKGPAVDELYLFAGALAPDLREWGIQSVPALGRWTGGPARWDWSAVRRALLGDVVLP